jgi:two-component system, cell cycle sensor histidine kinase and response regulator CckA
VWLPALTGEATASKPVGLPAQNWRGSGTILVVDDEEAIRLTAQGMLEVLGFQTVAAADGLEAIEIYRASSERFWCVLLDATRPKLGGEATFQELVRIRRNVRVVLWSGYTKDDIMGRFAGRGLSGFLQKPYTLQDLTAVLQSPSVTREIENPQVQGLELETGSELISASGFLALGLWSGLQGVAVLLGGFLPLR